MKIVNIWFDEDYIYGRDNKGKVWKQSLLWYPRLRNADKDDRENYRYCRDGIHWDRIDEAISFESFAYDDADPSALQKFFITHKELNVAEFAKRVGINASLLRNYINGFKRPSKVREEKILNAIYQLGKEYMAVDFKNPVREGNQKENG